MIWSWLNSAGGLVPDLLANLPGVGDSESRQQAVLSKPQKWPGPTMMASRQRRLDSDAQQILRSVPSDLPAGGEPGADTPRARATAAGRGCCDCPTVDSTLTLRLARRRSPDHST